MDKKVFFCLLFTSYFLLLTVPCLPAQTKSYDAALRLENEGKFQEATSLLEHVIHDDAGTLSSVEKEKILFQIERMRRIRIDYSLTADELFAELEQGVKNISKEECNKWIKEGKFDARVIDDTLRFVSTSRSNLFFRNPDIASRKISPTGYFGTPLPKEHEFHEALYNDCIAIEKAADSLSTPYVLPKDFKMEMDVTVDSGTVKAGDTVKAWLPIPHGFPYQKDFELLTSSSKPLAVAPADYPIRSVFMEQPADSNGGAKFTIEYTYKTFGVHFNLKPSKVVRYDKSDSIYKKFTSEAPNIIFTGKIKKLSKEIVGKERNPLLKAKKIYDWISRDIKYSFAREYSTINNISDYCLTKEYGDCGQEAMLFITLCRYNGVPARWQSGWFTFPNAKDIHDWTQIYVLPYGWIPVDPYMGIASRRYLMDSTAKQRKVVHDFYFGGLDQYRMSANSDNNQTLTPAKKYFRSDNVDFQRGEVETNKSNIYFNEFDYNLDIQEEKVTGNEL